MSTPEEEQLQTLPVNHPEAGYLSHDRSGVVGTGTVPPDEQAIYDERTAADEAAADAVAQHEHDVATAEEAPAAEAAKTEAAPKKSAKDSLS